MKTKTYQAQVKAADGDDGTFEALVSIFGNVDHAGDRVVKGAFTKSLQRWEESGDPIPVVFSHRWDDLDAHIGKVLEAEERDEGLWVKAQLDIADDPSAAKVHRLLKDRRIREFSFAYDVLDEKAQNGANELLELDVIEVGPTLKGMNPETVLIGAKNRQRKVYAPLAGSVEQLQQALREAVQAWAADGSDDDQPTWAWIEATFDDSVVFSVEGDEGSTYFQAGYTVADDDAVTLDEPTQVELDVEATIRAASRSAKAGRVLSSKNETKLRQAADLLTEVLAGVESTSDEDDEAKSTAKAEEPPGAKAEERETRSPSHVRLLADIDALADIAG